MKWLKNKIRKWIGISDGNLVAIDLGRMQSCIIIVSNAGRGRVEVIETYWPNYQQACHHIEQIKRTYKIFPTIDAPMDFRYQI